MKTSRAAMIHKIRYRGRVCRHPLTNTSKLTCLDHSMSRSKMAHLSWPFVEADLNRLRPQPWSYDYINNSPLFTCLNVERQTVFRYSRAYLPESREHIFEVVKMGPRVHVCEYSNMLRLHEAGLPVPRPIEYVPHPPKASRAWRERSRGKDWNYIRMENIEGEILEAEWGSLTDAQRTLMAKEALRFLDTMRRLPTATGDGTEPKYHFPISYGIDNCAARLALPRVTDDEEYSDYFINSFIFHEGEYSSHQDLILKFRQRMLEWKSSDERGRRVVTELLDKHMPPREAPPVITHGAFTLWDIVFSRSTWKISAVLDWSTAGVYPSY